MNCLIFLLKKSTRFTRGNKRMFQIQRNKLRTLQVSYNQKKHKEENFFFKGTAIGVKINCNVQRH
jgi:hypothetical protein